MGGRSHRAQAARIAGPCPKSNTGEEAMTIKQRFYLSGGGDSLRSGAVAVERADRGRHRQRRHRRRGQRSERTGGRRLGDRGNHRAAHELRQDGRHRRPGTLRHSRSADRELQRLGARLWAGRFAQAAGEARPASRSGGGAGPDAGSCGALLSGDLLVHDDEDSAGQRFRRLDRHPQEHHPGELAAADEQRRLRRLSSARTGIHAHHPGRSSVTSSRGRKHGYAASSPASPAR